MIAVLKHLVITVILSAILPWICSIAEAAWFIDAERFHVAVHGELSCQDCHEDINEKKRHPDPDNVNKALKDFFQPGQCTACHEEAAEEIAEGSHAGQEATYWQGFDNCIECHDPHYQVKSGDIDSVPDLSEPLAVKCSRCHEFQPKLPDFSDEDRACLQCHLSVSGDEPRSAEKTIAFCFHCHSSNSRQPGKQNDSYPLIDEAQYASTPHADVSCMVCHPLSIEFGHGDQPVGDCKQCHRPHDEKTAHDAHAGVMCGACHLNGVSPVRDSGSGYLGWRRPRYANRISPIHQMHEPAKEASCRVCHTKGNSIGAAAMVLPAKSIICMPCHTATFSIADTVTVLSLILFLFGFFAVGSVWFSGGDPSTGTRHNLKKSIRAVFGSIFSSQFLAIIKSIILDGLLQRRLFRISRERWLLHALIFYPFIFRFTWGMTALLASLWWPEWPGTWIMLDKNHPLTAFLFDFSGVIVIVGIVGMIIRRLQKRADQKFSGLPAADWAAYALLGSIILGGFILEGMRMAMTGSPGGAPYAFVGDAISRMLTGFELTAIYGYVWYLHAILTGAFLVYLPFSRMFHMIMAPVSLAMNAATKQNDSL
jgi:predicted CXXCH cytochrome family protein